MEDDEHSSGLVDTMCEPIKSCEDASIMMGWILLSSTRVLWHSPLAPKR